MEDAATQGEVGPDVAVKAAAVVRRAGLADGEVGPGAGRFGSGNRSSDLSFLHDKELSFKQD